MELPAHWSVILCMSKLKIYFCKACLYFFCQIDLPLLYFSKAFVEKKSLAAQIARGKDDLSEVVAKAFDSNSFTKISLSNFTTPKG